VSASQPAVLGAFAGLRSSLIAAGPRAGADAPVKAFLNALAIGIVIFLLRDVLTSARGLADTALGLHHYARAGR
jgi:ZIP family zinc transporter